MKTLMVALAILVSAFIPVNNISNFDYDASVEKEIITMNDLVKLDNNPVIPCSENANNISNSCECIAGASCKFKYQSSCKIVLCNGETLEDNTNYTVDKDKVIKIEVPCKSD